MDPSLRLPKKDEYNRSLQTHPILPNQDETLDSLVRWYTGRGFFEYLRRAQGRISNDHRALAMTFWINETRPYALRYRPEGNTYTGESLKAVLHSHEGNGLVEALNMYLYKVKNDVLDKSQHGRAIHVAYNATTDMAAFGSTPKNGQGQLYITEEQRTYRNIYPDGQEPMVSIQAQYASQPTRPDGKREGHPPCNCAECNSLSQLAYPNSTVHMRTWDTLLSKAMKMTVWEWLDNGLMKHHLPGGIYTQDRYNYNTDGLPGVQQRQADPSTSTSKSRGRGTRR
ncbi:hypothetical protein FA95DRAFT_766953 [Auriscalpium vulgare]|uniref:Uncharacterized protein n=1 Tax=Auriscalpium vulgare TaxID=40419 RepID=A0ACB8RAJ9_9AGAM|nr:hypothetical protein FA95DRAFT_766953 [Auriscalpium vulgare]